MLARAMRGALVLGSVVLAALAIVAIVWRGDDPPALDTGTRNGATATGGTPPELPIAAGTGGALVATRSEVTVDPGPPLADAPTACLRVVDRDGERPVAGAPVRRVQTGADIAFTDERGLAAVPLRDPEQLAVVVEGYLLALVPTRLGTTEAEPQLVQLLRDQWSIVRRFVFAAPGGNPPGDVFVRFRPSGNTKPAGAPVPAGDAVAQRAWAMHVMLAGRPVCADVPVQLGSWNEDRVHRLTATADVRFVGPGEFTLEAATTSGLVARQHVRIDASPRTDAPPIRVALADGAFVAGTVHDTRGAPLGGARVTLQGSDPLGLEASSAADGTFRLGPLSPTQGTLHVRHRDHEPLAFGPVAIPSTGSDVVLAALPATTIRGRVLARPGGAPIANATVAWHPAAGGPVAARTGADGAFTLRATGTSDSRLAITALGFVAYAELVAPGSPFADYSLWPAPTADRLAHGMSALLEGIVVDAQGRPVPGAEVRWHPTQPPAPAPGVPGRRVLEGGALELPLGARTGSDGAFRLETNAFGPGRLALADGASAVDATATAGQTVHGLRLQQ